MSLTITDFNQLHDYFDKVIGRTHHHAHNVDEIALSIIGAVLWKATKEITVREQDGETKNVLWFTVGSNKYVLRYKHLGVNTGAIELLRGSLQGVVIHSFDNSIPTATIKQVFGLL